LGYPIVFSVTKLEADKDSYGPLTQHFMYPLYSDSSRRCMLAILSSHLQIFAVFIKHAEEMQSAVILTLINGLKFKIYLH
jgi:hypothetical protein